MDPARHRKREATTRARDGLQGLRAVNQVDVQPESPSQVVSLVRVPLTVTGDELAEVHDIRLAIVVREGHTGGRRGSYPTCGTTWIV